MRGAHARPARWAPQTRMGRWTVRLAVGAVAGLVLLGVGFALGAVESASSFSDNWLLTTWGTAILATGVAAVVTGLLAVGREHDRSWVVWLVTCLGSMVAAVMVNEVVQGF